MCACCGAAGVFPFPLENKALWCLFWLCYAECKKQQEALGITVWPRHVQEDWYALPRRPDASLPLLLCWSVPCPDWGSSNVPLGGGEGSKNRQTTPPTSSTAPAHQRRGSANAETTPAGAPAAAADRTQRPDATCGGKNG